MLSTDMLHVVHCLFLELVPFEIVTKYSYPWTGLMKHAQLTLVLFSHDPLCSIAI